MKKLFITLCSIALFITGSAWAQDDLGDTGGLASLRGEVRLQDTNPADDFEHFPKEAKYESSYVYQPPLIPHSIRHYEVSLNANKCLSCHAWKMAKDSGATKISVTHYVNRQDAVLADVSPRRYFCLQCHVPQAEKEALVGNDFERVESLRND